MKAVSSISSRAVLAGALMLGALVAPTAASAQEEEAKALTVSGSTIWDEVRDVVNWNEDVILPTDRPLTVHGPGPQISDRIRPAPKCDRHHGCRRQQRAEPGFTGPDAVVSAASPCREIRWFGAAPDVWQIRKSSATGFYG